jgi:hypothetical protein
MKIYNKNGFIQGLIFLAIFMLGVIAIVIKGFSVKIMILSILMFLISITYLIRSFSKKATLEDVLLNHDERDRLIEGINVVFTILFMIAYAITKVSFFLGAFIATSCYVTITFIVALATNIYYEKHE